MAETLVCAHCSRSFEKAVGQANAQRRKHGVNVRFFCTQRCCGAAKRVNKSAAQLVAEKAAYDRAYRDRNRAMLKAKKRAYFEKTYDPAQAREARKPKRDAHRAYLAEYNARPEWKRHKYEYDRDRRAAVFGAFAESHKVLVALQKEIRKQPWYERAKERGYYNNNRQTNQRKRNEQISRW